jgi:hypothetical protein
MATTTTQTASAIARATAIGDELRSTVQQYVGSTGMIISGIDDLINGLEEAWLEAGQQADACTHEGDWIRDQHEVTRCRDCSTVIDRTEYL